MREREHLLSLSLSPQLRISCYRPPLARPVFYPLYIPPLSSLETHSHATYAIRLAPINSLAWESHSQTPHFGMFVLHCRLDLSESKFLRQSKSAITLMFEP